VTTRDPIAIFCETFSVFLEESIDFTEDYIERLIKRIIDSSLKDNNTNLEDKIDTLITLTKEINSKIQKTYNNEGWVMKAMEVQGFIKDKNEKQCLFKLRRNNYENNNSWCWSDGKSFRIDVA